MLFRLRAPVHNAVNVKPKTASYCRIRSSEHQKLILFIEPQIFNKASLWNNTFDRNFKLPGNQLLKLQKYSIVRQGRCCLGAQFTKQPGKLLNGHSFFSTLIRNRNVEVPFRLQK